MRTGVFSNTVKRLSPGTAGQIGTFSEFCPRKKSRGGSRNKGRDTGPGEILNLEFGI